MVSERLGRLKTGAIDETKKLFGVFVYLWILLTLFSLHKAFIFNEDILTYQQGFALINAFALAKIVLVGQSLHVGDRLRNKPLIYPILFKAAIFAVILLCFHVIEETLIGVWHGKAAAESVPTIGDGTLQAILMAGIIMFVALIPFFAFMELERAIGPEELHALLFGHKTRAGAPSINSELQALEDEQTPPSSEGQSSIAIWYYERAGKGFGPVTEEFIKTLLKNNEINKNTYVWNSSFGNQWRSIQETGLF